jgi:PIN domain nuclease of toxin-antitoxin system
VKIIIDTHIFLWLLYDTKKIEKNHIKLLLDMTNTIYLSSISVAEIMIKKSIGTLDVSFDLFEVLDTMGLEILDFDGLSAIKLGSLPMYHRDPFDRMIISQAMCRGYKLLSYDGKFTQYGCELV